MRDFFLEEKKPIITLLCVFLLLFILNWGKCGDLILDCGREVYIPYAISKGEVLYKDIFCIYSAFPYLFNTFFIKIFGANLSVYYFIGGIFAAAYTLGTYACSRYFLPKIISFCLAILIMLSVVFDGSIFNFIFPYSYAMVFSATFAIWILYFILCYIKTKNKNLLYMSAFLWGGICVSKIDFIFVILPILFVYALYEKDKKEVFVKSLAYALSLPVVTYLVLFAQGLRVSDIIKNSHYLTSMIKSESLATFYSNYSLVSFNINHFSSNLVDLISLIFISAIFFAVILYALRTKKQILKYGLSSTVTAFFCLIFFLQEDVPQKMFALLPYICTIILIFKLINYLKSKDYKNQKHVAFLILIFFSLLCSLKNYHSLMLGFYGAYSLCGLLISITVFIERFFENNLLYNSKRQYDGALTVYLITIILLFAHQTLITLVNENNIVKTAFGTHKTTKNIAQSFNEALGYLNRHSNKNETLLVMPEGIMLNFLSGLRWDFYQTSFIPLDFESFREDNIIKDITNKKPDYIIFTSRNTSEYGKGRICRDYGIETCKYVVSNYTLEAAFGDKFRIFLFKLLEDKADNEKEN